MVLSWVQPALTHFVILIGENYPAFWALTPCWVAEPNVAFLRPSNQVRSLQVAIQKLTIGASGRTLFRYLGKCMATGKKKGVPHKLQMGRFEESFVCEALGQIWHFWWRINKCHLCMRHCSHLGFAQHPEVANRCSCVKFCCNYNSLYICSYGCLNFFLSLELVCVLRT